MDLYAAKAVPLVGTLEGFVHVKALAGATPAAGIPVSLDGNRVATTSPDGRYCFEEVAEGSHEVALSAAQLPADYDPGPASSAHLLVQPRRAARADFEVLPLVSLEGRVTGLAGAPLDGIVIRMVPGSRYTATSDNGYFAFHNLSEGDFEVVLDLKSLPENSEITSPPSVSVVLRLGSPAPPIGFSFASTSKQKPIRKVPLDRK